MQQSRQQIVAVVLLTGLGLGAASVLLGRQDWPLLLAVLPLSVVLPIGVARLLPVQPGPADPSEESTAWKASAVGMLVAALLSTAAVLLLRPELNALSDRLLSPFFFPATRWLWHALSWAAIVVFPLMLVSLGLDLALLLGLVLLGLVLCSSLPSLGALLGWLVVYGLRAAMRPAGPTSAAPR